MQSDGYWLLKELKKIDKKIKENKFLKEDAYILCKELNERDYATSLFAAMFDITTRDTAYGRSVRKIDEVVMGSMGTDPEIKEYDKRMINAMDSEVLSNLQTLCNSIKKKYPMNGIPDVDSFEFKDMQQIVKRSKRKKIFNPMNLRC
jgi:hypothetical protein